MKRILFLAVCLLFSSIFMQANAMNSLSVNVKNSKYWDNPKRIKVYIPQNRRRIIVRDSFKAWVNATNEEIGFDFIDYKKKANIEIEFVDKIPDGKLEKGEILGITYSHRIADGRLSKAKIQIPYKAQNGIVLDDITLSHVLIHEIGHALGLKHSDNSKSIMYYLTNKNQSIQKEDIQKLRNIYGW